MIKLVAVVVLQLLPPVLLPIWCPSKGPLPLPLALCDLGERAEEEPKGRSKCSKQSKQGLWQWWVWDQSSIGRKTTHVHFLLSFLASHNKWCFKICSKNGTLNLICNDLSHFPAQLEYPQGSNPGHTLMQPHPGQPAALHAQLLYQALGNCRTLWLAWLPL